MGNRANQSTGPALPTRSSLNVQRVTAAIVSRPPNPDFQL